VPATHTLTVTAAREQYEAHISLMAAPAAVGNVSQRTIQGPVGSMALRIYTPSSPPLVSFHGSSFVPCSLGTHDGMCRNLCAGAVCLDISVDYRLAPEYEFPAAIDDCVFATRWVAEHATELNADPTRIIVAGDSVGGTLAAAMSLRLRDEDGPSLCGQLLMYPITTPRDTG
jgi:acetyl esterase